jgi:drug/metabolite transporter (DMT)-like permease
MSRAWRWTARLGSPRGERLRADLILLAVALVWGSGFVGGRVAGAHLNAFVYNGVRFLLGALVLLPFAGRRLPRLSQKELWGGAVAGLVLLCAANLQQVGLQSTTAGKAGFITGLYVVLVPLLTALVWRRTPPWLAWVACIVATAGLFLLGGVESLALAPGDGWVLAGALFWALHIVLMGSLAPQTDPLRLAIVQFAVCGLLSTVLGPILDPRPFAGWDVAWWAIVYNGVLSVGLGLTLQLVGQQHAPATDAAIILRLEAVFAALFGWLLLSESLTVQQLIGCGLMLGGMLLAQLRASRMVPA